MLKYLFIVLGVIAGYEVVILAMAYFRDYNIRKREKAKKHMMIAVRVSKENEAGPIVAEQIFASIHGVYKKIGRIKRFLGYDSAKISFEIANVDDSIRFFIRFPANIRNLVEGQIYAQYPDVEIEVVEDYSMKNPVEIMNKKEGENALAVSGNPAAYNNGFTEVDVYNNAVGCELSFDAPDIYPIKRYQQFEDKLTRVAVDPLSSITATLSRLNTDGDEAWVQIVVKPLEDKWRIILLRAIKIIKSGFLGTFEWMQKGFLKIFCTRKAVYKWLFFPFYFFLWLKGVRQKTRLPEQQNASDGEDDLDAMVDSRHDRETSVQAAADKVVKLLFEAKIRIVYAPQINDKIAAEDKLREIVGAFKQFHVPNINGFKIDKIGGREIVKKYQERTLNDSFVLNTEELATIFHLPSITVTTPGIYWVRSKKVEPPSDLPTKERIKDTEGLTTLGKTNYRDIRREFGIKTLDRRRHMYIIGKTGMGKSTLLENMLYSDIQSGKGVAVVDPHGDLADRVLSFVPSSRTNDVIVFDPSDRDYPVSFNMLENIDPAFNTIVASGLVGIFKKIYADSWGPRLEHILRNTILSLLSYPDTTMLGITRILQDPIFRSRVVKKITDPIVRNFWINEFEKFDPRQRIEAISPILNKVGQFLSSPIIRNIVGQPKSSIDLRFAMDKKKIVVVNLSKGKIGEDNSSLLGSMMITKFQLDAMSRANIPEKDRTDFYLYVDEFQNFATDSFATILSEARKYKLNLTMANQYIAQMPDEVRDAVFGNVGSIFAFQVGFDDAEYLMQQFAEEVTTNDLVSLSKYTGYLRLLIDGMPSKTFSLDTIPPPEIEFSDKRVESVIKTSRERYAKKREMVEEKILKWSMNTEHLKDGKKKQLPSAKK